MLSLENIDPSHGVTQCGLCDENATCVLHDSQSGGTSNRMMFFCRKHIRSYLEAHPRILETLLDRMGNQSVFSFY
jgi:hypothetical protein